MLRAKDVTGKAFLTHGAMFSLKLSETKVKTCQSSIGFAMAAYPQPVHIFFSLPQLCHLLQNQSITGRLCGSKILHLTRNHVCANKSPPVHNALNGVSVGSMAY